MNKPKCVNCLKEYKVQQMPDPENMGHQSYMIMDYCCDAPQTMARLGGKDFREHSADLWNMSTLRRTWDTAPKAYR